MFTISEPHGSEPLQAFKARAGNPQRSRQAYRSELALPPADGVGWRCQAGHIFPFRSSAPLRRLSSGIRSAQRASSRFCFSALWHQSFIQIYDTPTHELLLPPLPLHFDVSLLAQHP
eukprot:763562-Hanusia_phi.AAC.4